MIEHDDLSAPSPNQPVRDAADFPRPGQPAAKAPLPAPEPKAQTEAPAAAVAPVPPVRRSRRRLVLLPILLAALGFGGYEGQRWWTDGRFIVSTDDAYVQADVTILAAKASGYISAIAVAANQQVEAGQVIARIDDVDYRLAVQAAADKLATQRSAIERIGRQVEAAEAQVAQARPQIEAAKAEVLRSGADFERQTRLSQADYASKARLEQSRADRDRADANQKGAEAALLAAQANVAVFQAQQAEAEKVAAELATALDKSKRDLSFTEVRAPVTGVVGNRAIEVGSYVQPGTRLAALVPLQSARVDANFKETQLGRIHPGQLVEIEVDAYAGRRLTGRVESVSPASGSQFSLLPPENATGNFTKIVQRVPVRIAVDPKDVREGILRPGLSVVARVDTRTSGETAAR